MQCHKRIFAAVQHSAVINAVMQTVKRPSLTQLSAIRRALGWSQAELGKRVGFTQQYVSALERGLMPTEDEHVSRLAEALGVEAHSLSAVRIQIDMGSPSGAVIVTCGA
jgi:predicted transcriptional regulator